MNAECLDGPDWVSLVYYSLVSVSLFLSSWFNPTSFFWSVPLFFHFLLLFVYNLSFVRYYWSFFFSLFNMEFALGRVGSFCISAFSSFAFPFRFLSDSSGSLHSVVWQRYLASCLHLFISPHFPVLFLGFKLSILSAVIQCIYFS